MALLDAILFQRRSNKHFDEALLDFVDTVQKPRLGHLSDDQHKRRLTKVERNISYSIAEARRQTISRQGVGGSVRGGAFACDVGCCCHLDPI